MIDGRGPSLRRDVRFKEFAGDGSRMKIALHSSVVTNGWRGRERERNYLIESAAAAVLP